MSTMEYENRITKVENNTMLHKRKIAMRDEPCRPAEADYAWETSKENVMPLKRGRNISDLNRALRMHDSFQAMTSLDAEAHEMEQRVQLYEGDDPISVWVQFVRWIEKNRPEDTRKKFAVLEKCTRQLKDHIEYKNDLRYIRLWIQYADLVSNPKDIFKYLYQNKIGEHVSLFYVGWAWVLESMGNYPQAHKVYLKGMQKKAQPHDMLERKNKEFQRRMSRHWLKVSSNETAGSFPRQVLDDMTEERVDFQHYENSDRLRRYAQKQAEKTHAANAHKPVFTIYQDPIGADADVFDINTNWKILGTMKHQNKENDIAPAQWTEGPLCERDSQQEQIMVRQPSTRPFEKLQVFVDDEFSLSEQKYMNAAIFREPSLSLRQRIDGISTEEEELARKPLKNFDVPQVQNRVKPKATICDKPCVNNHDRLACDTKQLISSTGEVLCFEEVRARTYTARCGHRSTISSRSKSECGSENAATTDQSQMQTGGEYMLPRPNENVFHRPLNIPTEVNIAYLDNAAQEDMTINTRVAMEDVNNMFCSPPRVSTKTWDLPDPEPVERKLHFSIFDDSVESVSIPPADASIRHDATTAAEKKTFSVFTDDFAAKSTSVPRTASNLSSRKPLTSRDDLTRRDKLTNKDMILKMQSSSKRGTPHPSSKPR